MSTLNKIWTKKIPIINKKGVSQETNILNEINIQKIASTYGFTPKILNVIKTDLEYQIQMEQIGSDCLANQYGENPSDIPEEFWDQMRCIVNILLVREGIEYIDITPYNFIELNNKIYLIDFGHARFRTKSTQINWFLKRFLFGMINEYNPDFR